MSKRDDDDDYEFAYLPDYYGHPIPIGHIRRTLLKLILRALLALADGWDFLTAPRRAGSR